MRCSLMAETISSIQQQAAKEDDVLVVLVRLWVEPNFVNVASDFVLRVSQLFAPSRLT